MAKTMVANIPGARLRAAERQLATLRGEDAVIAFIEAHPNETKVLQQLVEARRAGRPAPALGRIQRAMLWSDGTIEYSTTPGNEAPARGSRREVAGQSRAGTQDRLESNGGRTSAGGRLDGRRSLPAARSAPGTPPPDRSELRARAGQPRGRPRGGRRAGAYDPGSARDLPRSGEGWRLLRPGEVAPEDQPAEAPWAETVASATVPPEDEESKRPA